MKNILIIICCSFFFSACEKDSVVANLSVQGYWNVLRDTSFTSNPANASADLFHLFREPNAYYRFSFPKTFDYSVLTAKPRSDSMISYYQTVENELMLPNPAPSTTNVLPGNILLSQTEVEMKFTRTIITKRNATTGKIEATRTDTIQYIKVTDPVKINYFDNYLKQWHP